MFTRLGSFMRSRPTGAQCGEPVIRVVGRKCGTDGRECGTQVPVRQRRRSYLQGWAMGDFIAKYELLSGLGVVVITAVAGLLIRRFWRRPGATRPAAPARPAAAIDAT